MSISYHLKALLADANMTQKELAEATGLDRLPYQQSVLALSSSFPLGRLTKFVKCFIASPAIYWNISRMTRTSHKRTLKPMPCVRLCSTKSKVCDLQALPGGRALFLCFILVPSSSCSAQRQDIHFLNPSIVLIRRLCAPCGFAPFPQEGRTCFGLM